MACLMNVASGLGATGRSTKHFTNAARRSSTTSTRRLSARAARGRSHLVCKASAENINWGREVSTAAIRVGAGVLMVHNGLDKLVDPEGFASFVVEPFLGFLPHQEPLSYVTWTYLAAGAELAGAAGLTLVTSLPPTWSPRVHGTLHGRTRTVCLFYLPYEVNC